MPLIPKPNYNQIFASQAPDQDKPAVFNNYPLGWGVESRPNNGKPTIKGFNYLQQTSDLKDLWILQNGACLPYDESIEYAEGAPVLKDGVIQYKTANGFKSRDFVTVPTYSNSTDGVDPVTGVADGAYFNVRSSSDESYINEYQNVGGSAIATGKSYLSALGVQLQEKPASTIRDASGKDQQEVNNDQHLINTSIESNLNKYGYTSSIMNVANNIADISSIPKNNVSGKMIVRIAQYPVGIGTVGSRYYVCTSKGGNSNSYTFFELRRGVTTTTGSIGGNAELLRVTSVYDGAHAWTGRHAKSGESASGDWLEVAYTPPGYTDANKFSRSITTGIDLWKYYQVQGSGVKHITFNTPFDANGEACLQFYATSASAADVKIYIDDVLHKTVSLVAATAAVTRVKLEATTGYHTVKVERPTTGVVNVFGVNYSDVKDAKYGTALDGFVMWHNNVMFTNSEGANDYAIIDATSGLLGGSFHGGETLQSETYIIDGVVGNPMAAITLCKNIEIRQNTKIQWASASMDVASTHRFDEDSGYRLDTTFTGNVTSNTFYTAMHTTPVSYSIVSYPQYMDLSSAPDGFKKLDRSNLVVQDDPTTGKRIYSEMTLFNADLGNIYGGPSIRKVSGSYNKMYYGIAISSPQNITVTTLKSTLTKQFI